jgi:hypothetical protein
MKERIAMALLLALVATSASAQSRRGGGGGRPSGGHFARSPGGGGRGLPGGSGGGGVYARPRGGGGPTGAQLRHPRAGTGSYYYGHRYGHGHGHYPYYGRSYGYYPYYGGYGYYPYAYGYPAFSLGLGFYYGGGQPATVYGDDTSGEPYGGGDGGPDEGYYGREDPRGAATAELRLDVQPDDASIYVDDEFRGIARRLPSLRVTPGRHRVEAVRPGFPVAERRVEVGPGETVSVQIDLERP